MKNQSWNQLAALFIVACLFFVSDGGIFAQKANDSTYLPPIKITSVNGYGPYFINTKRTNVFFVYELPANTSKITMRFIDSKGVQLGVAFTKEGSNLEDAVWDVESEDVGFALSPQLSVEIQYSTDSLAVYRIPYLVYPDTVKLFATAGWGPFITNNYPLSDTSWHPVPELYNTFTVNNLPPRTDTLEFQLLAADSTVIDSLWVFAPQGEYLDSAVYANIRMDSLPLETRYLHTLIWCEGGSNDGLAFHHDLKIITQQPKLVSKSDNSTLEDSIGVFIENQFAGQSLLLDSTKHAKISNGPKPPYASNTGPYSLNLFDNDYSIEAWVKFDLEKVHNIFPNGMSIMRVDSAWEFSIFSWGSIIYFEIRSLAVDYNCEIFTATVHFWELSSAEWHHFAFANKNPGTGGPPHIDFYFDGLKWDNTNFHYDNFDYIKENVNYWDLLRTQPLFLGNDPAQASSPSYVIAIDEVRIWECTLSAEDVKNNYHRTILQEDFLLGYWNFNDLRNRLGYIVDISYYNNTGYLNNGATFIPQYPLLQTTIDTISVTSSNAHTDSVVFSFVDVNNYIVYTDTINLQNAKFTLPVDISELPYNISKLSISEHYPGVADTGFTTNYELLGLPPTPIATPHFNWNRYYYSPASWSKFYNSIVVSALPDNTSKVVLGYQKDGIHSDVMTFSKNSIPYRYSLTLNGTDNYIETTNQINAPAAFTLELWFKTTTSKGGKIIGFTDTRSGITSGKHDREIIMEKDGSLRLYLRYEGTTFILSAVNKYNDGEWHHVAVDCEGNTKLYVDGSPVDENENAIGETYSGYWVIGRNNETKGNGPEAIAEYFEGSLCEISITDIGSDTTDIIARMYSERNETVTKLYYKLDEGSGTTIHDHSGNNDGELKGSSQRWYNTDAISFVVWHGNMIDKLPGTYYFYATVYYPGGPSDGATYMLGKNIVIDPLPGHYFAYNLRKGFGYFNEGTPLINCLEFQIDYSNSGTPNWKEDFVRYKFFTLDHYLIDQQTYTYYGGNVVGELWIDMGDASPGSYLIIEIGYKTTDDVDHVQHSFSLPIYTNPMLQPIVSGNFGPFDQAIAPGSMEQLNTFIITTEIIADLNHVNAKFYDKYGKELAEIAAVKINDTTWHITYDMGKLSPPISKLTIEYFLGSDPQPALIEGPFIITIHKTRPAWFDFIADTSFHDVQQTGDEVTFSIVTPFEESYLINNSEPVEIPEWVPLIGGTSAEMESPTAEAYLKYIVPEYKLEMNQSPDFFQKVFNLGAGTAETFRFGFNYSQHNTYAIDSNNNLLATQNFSIGGSLTSGFKKLENIVKKVKEIIEAAKVTDPESIIVSPSFSLTYTGSFEYSSRQHLKIDTNTGKWGSFGNLKVDANPEHENAYKNSASFKFYSGSMGIEFSVGAALLEGLIEGDFGLDGRFVLGFGHSYTTIPKNSTRRLKAFAFQTYGRFYISVLWGWYEKTVWGPKLFYSTTIWGDDMTDAFPPLGKKEYSPLVIKAHSSWPELGDAIIPVRKFSQMPMPCPQPKVISSGGFKLFSWIEKGNNYGERSLMSRYLADQNRKFSGERKIEFNNNAINGPVADALNKNTAFFSWAQTRYDPKSITQVKPNDVLKEFVKSQDIWFAVYDLERDSLIQKNMLHDDTSSCTAGRAESNPVVTALSESRAIIIWQVADIDAHRSEIWHSVLQKQGDQWTASSPEIMTETEGVATQLKIVSPEENLAVAVWMNTSRDNTVYNKIMTAIYDGSEWLEPAILDDQPHHYYNYFDMCFREGLGGLVMTSFIEDSAYNHYETLTLHTWDAIAKQWDSPFELMADSINHLQFPRMAINDDGKTTVAIKVEKFIIKDEFERISQVDLLIGDLNNPDADWTHIEAHEFVCDTTKQVDDLQLTYVDSDTLMILSNEYPMLATNVNFEPVNGIIFGDPYMNLVLRCFSVDDEGTVKDVDENNYFLGIYDPIECHSDINLYQNYPNPCRDYTTIKFDIPDNSHIKLEIYDMNGILTATLINQSLMYGQYEIRLNTAVLQPGTYIIKLTSDDSMKTLRMIVNK